MNDAFDVIEGEVVVRDGRIESIGSSAGAKADRVIDAHGSYLLPGLIQTHIHLCQTLFRGYADDLALLDWLKTRVWPMEAAHTPASLAAAAQQAASELLRSGTTTVLTMETVHDTDAVFEALEPMGLRAVVGKCMMDADSAVPPRLLEETPRSIDESVAIAKRWHGRANGRLRAAFAPRFAVSCSRELLEAVARLAIEHQLVIHTHASENRDEIALIRSRTGRKNIDYLADTGLTSPHLCLAHCVWVDDDEQSLMAERGVKVLHCPGSNLKLGSGLAPIVEMRAKGISVSLGPMTAVVSLVNGVLLDPLPGARDLDRVVSAYNESPERNRFEYPWSELNFADLGKEDLSLIVDFALDTPLDRAGHVDGDHIANVQNIVRGNRGGGWRGEIPAGGQQQIASEPWKPASDQPLYILLKLSR